MMNARTNPNRASASVKAMPRNMVVRTMPADSGCLAIAVMALADDEADADAGADRGAAIDDASADGREARLELARVLLRKDVKHCVSLGEVRRPLLLSVVGVHQSFRCTPQSGS